MNSSELKGFLTGLILGDGCIDKGVTKRAFEIKSINNDFIIQIYNDLISCTNFDVELKGYPSLTKGGVNHKRYLTLRVKAHPWFAKKYHHFYDDMRRRVVSKEAMLWLTPRGLACWYMSDGYVCHVGKTKGNITRRYVDICTDRYKKNTVEALQNMMFTRFGIKTSIIKRSNAYRLRILKDSYEDFFNAIREYIVPSMSYKMYLGYAMQPKWMSDEFWKFQVELGSAITRDHAG